MTTTIVILIACAMTITSIVSFAKPSYKDIVWKRSDTVSIWLSFVLWIIAAFSVQQYLWFNANIWMLVLIWLWLWTWSNLFYDIRELIKDFSDNLKTNLD